MHHKSTQDNLQTQGKGGYTYTTQYHYIYWKKKSTAVVQREARDRICEKQNNQQTAGHFISRCDYYDAITWNFLRTRRRSFFPPQILALSF